MPVIVVGICVAHRRAGWPPPPAITRFRVVFDQLRHLGSVPAGPRHLQDEWAIAGVRDTVGESQMLMSGVPWSFGGQIGGVRRDVVVSEERPVGATTKPIAPVERQNPDPSLQW